MKIADKSAVDKAYHEIRREIKYKTGAINLCNLGLEKIPQDIFKLTHLTQLNLWRNNISQISSDIGKLTNLKTLVLTSNKIKQIPEELSNLKKLEILLLGSNNVNNIASLYYLESLSILVLSNNEISLIPKGIERLKNLKTIILNGNKIKNLPKEICELEKLRELLVRNNPLENIPIEYSEKTFEDIKFYLMASSQEDTVKLYEAKMLIVGEPFAGKTSLCKKIINPDYELDKNEKSTEGIEVFKYNFPINGSDQFSVNMWDFGGQEIYHSTHHFFLTKRSLYVLLTDNRANNTDFDYWLNIIKLLGSKSPVLIVQNEKQGWKKALNAKQLSTICESIISVSQIDLATNRGLEGLLEQVQHQCSKLPHIGNDMPISWVNLRAELEDLSRTKNHITYIEYLEIFRKYEGTSFFDPYKISEYFHDLGIFLHFKDNPLLSKHVFLNTSWSTNAVYSILSSKVLVEKSGCIQYEDFISIWESSGFNQMHNELLELMLKFELCYKIEDSLLYIFPKELPYSPEQYPLTYRFDAKDSIVLELSYLNFMPKGILTRFIVKMNNNIENREYVWRDSVLLKGRNSKALVVEDYSRKKIFITVAEKRRTDLLAVILNQFDKVHNAYRDLKVTPLIPCRCKVCKKSDDKTYYNYDELRDKNDNMEEKVICNKSNASVFILQMLNLYEKEYISSIDQQEKRIYKYYINLPNARKVENLYVNKQITDQMKIKNVKISGGNQQFADKIINQHSTLNHEDREFIEFIQTHITNEDEKQNIIDSLNKLKSQDSSVEEKKRAGNLIKVFAESGVKEISKNLINYLIGLGVDLVQQG